MENNQSETAVATMVDETPTTLIAQEQFDKILKINETCQEAQTQIVRADAANDMFLKALITARATRALQGLLSDDLMRDIMALQSTPLGFRTDRDREKPKGYTVDIVRDVVIQALMRGFQVTGNQINIIGGNLYVTKEGFEHRLGNYDGLSNLEMDFEVPDLARQGTALCGCVARWIYCGELCEINCTKSVKGDYRIPVRINSGMGDDAILGKAKSKLLRKIYERVSGQVAPGVDDHNTIDADEVDEALPEVTPPAIAAQTATEPIEEKLLADIMIGLEQCTTREQLNGFYLNWKQKAKNRDWTSGQLATLAQLCARKAQTFNEPVLS